MVRKASREREGGQEEHDEVKYFIKSNDNQYFIM